MRTKGGLKSEVVESGDWKDQGVRGNPMSTLEVKMVDGKRKILIHSFSGNERNKLFMNRGGESFEDVSTYSGSDSVTDSRCFAYWDFNHDGATDLALINSNAPHLQVYQNQITDRVEGGGEFVVVKLVGGNDQPAASADWSNRDGIGAKVLIQTGGKQLLRELRRGEGFSVQNTAQLIVGLNDFKQADSIEVHWPSGRSQNASSIPSGSCISFFENVDSSPDGNGFQIDDYTPAGGKRVAATASSTGVFNFDVPDSTDETKIHVLINMATWCESCRQKMPAVKTLMATVNDPAVAFVGVPIDTEDSSEKLDKYIQQVQPPYAIISDLTAMYRKGMSGYLKQQLGSDVLPNTVITDNRGNPLHTQFGLPTVSQIRRLVEAAK